MHNLDQSIAEWRASMRRTPSLGPEVLDELESHLRETISELVQSGMPEPDAFQRAIAQLGPMEAVTAEFQKLRPPTWLPMKVVVVITGIMAVAMPVMMAGALRQRGGDVLVMAHTFMLTMGYVMTLLLGVLGICFMAQRCYAEFSARRQEVLARAVRLYSFWACVLTIVGMILGMGWSYREWGRWWGWDVREIGALGVITWQVCFFGLQRSRRTTLRSLFAASLAGGSIMLVVMFMPVFFSVGAHAYGKPAPSAGPVLLMFMTYVLSFLIGLGPAGWLRPKKESVS
jgi:hypothetical protein